MVSETKKSGKMLLLNIKNNIFSPSRKVGKMEKEKKETRGAKKGRPKPAGSGRKKADPGFENKKVSVALPSWMWEDLTERARKQEITRNRLIKNILEIYLRK